MSNATFFQVQLGKAIALAATLFADKTDKGGHPYILHCLRVMNSVGDDAELKTIAILHDVTEDIPEYSLSRLQRELNLGVRITSALFLLNHSEGSSYDDYIRALTVNADATIVKRADLIDNSNITRLKGLRKKDFDRLEKYHRAFVYLSN
jgi:GTP diphosphokinase / guanosine-3',5'-bis(diphosphate) 3'-diphosphatase